MQFTKGSEIPLMLGAKAFTMFTDTETDFVATHNFFTEEDFFSALAMIAEKTADLSVVRASKGDGFGEKALKCCFVQNLQTSKLEYRDRKIYILGKKETKISEDEKEVLVAMLCLLFAHKGERGKCPVTFLLSGRVDGELTISYTDFAKSFELPGTTTFKRPRPMYGDPNFQ